MRRKRKVKRDRLGSEVDASCEIKCRDAEFKAQFCEVNNGSPEGQGCALAYFSVAKATKPVCHMMTIDRSSMLDGA